MISLALLLLGSHSLIASEIFHWVDQNGVHHFDQAKPVEVSTPVSTVEIENDLPSDFDPEADIFDVEGQAERMEELRAGLARQERVSPYRTSYKEFSDESHRQKSYSRNYNPGWKNRGPKRFNRNNYWDKDDDNKKGKRKQEPYRTQTLVPPGRRVRD